MLQVIDKINKIKLFLVHIPKDRINVTTLAVIGTDQCRLNAWACWVVSLGSHEHRSPMQCTAYFLIFKH